MSLEKSAETSIGRTKAGARKSWSKPQVKQMRAGSAENRPGNRAFDGILEGMGS